MEKSKLKSAINEADNITEKNGVIVQGGKKYLMVKDRVIVFRNHFGEEWGIETNLLFSDEKRVVVDAKIKNEKNEIIGSGLAEEYRNSSNVNRTSAVENAESSAIGRALASLGLHGGEYASAEEIVNAINNQQQRTTTKITSSSSNWREVRCINGKNKDTPLGELSESDLKWNIEKWQPWRGEDGNLEPSQKGLNFRAALDEAKKEIYSDGSEIEPIDLEVRDNGTDASASVEDEQTNEMRPDDEDDVPF